MTEIRTERAAGGAGNKLQHLRYTYDAVGNIVEKRDDADWDPDLMSALDGGNARYTYDALYRLVKATGRSAKPKRHPWASLLKRVFLVDVTECPDCGGRMKWLEVCTEQRDIHRVLSAHGLAPRAPPQVEWTPLGQMRFSF